MQLSKRLGPVINVAQAIAHSSCVKLRVPKRQRCSITLNPAADAIGCRHDEKGQAILQLRPWLCKVRSVRKAAIQGAMAAKVQCAAVPDTARGMQGVAKVQAAALSVAE